MEIRGIERKYCEITMEFPKYKTKLVKIFKTFYLVNHLGYFMPDNYSETDMNLETYHYAKDNANYRMDEIYQKSENLFEFYIYINSGRSDFRWINERRGLLHPRGNRFIYSEQEMGFGTMLKETNTLYMTEEHGIREMKLNFYSKKGCHQVLSILEKNNNSMNYNILNNHDYDYLDLNPYEILLNKYFNSQGENISKSYNWEVGICDSYLKLKSSLNRNINILLNENMKIGIPRGIFPKETERRISVKPIEKILNHLEDNNLIQK